MMVRYFLFLLAVVGVEAVQAQTPQCGNVFARHPWDYADPINHGQGAPNGRSNVKMVENRHFTKNVQNLIKGESTNSIMADLAYTLNKFPNHYPALMSLINYDARLDGQLPHLSKYDYPQTIECYFVRAMQFRPGDAKVKQLYGIYFYRQADFEQAINYFKQANVDLKSPELDYNIGLAYFELGDLKEAKSYAELAYGNKFPLPGLKNKLNEKGIALTATEKTGG